MSRAESVSVRDTPAAPAPSSSRGSNIPSRKPAPVEHCANVDVIRQALEAERASTASWLSPPPPKAGRIATMLSQRQPTGDANAAVLESISGSARVTVFRPSQQDVLADNGRRWLSKLSPP
ncbi:uncharacterized protein BBA_09282 [Beauveria bassiana ARSEF 2860]|uniref:Uncharacterized protein n=1 Tax=Beauveria bassiana (strain ARSEF 2860) TaxID=655819 RepID=J5JDD7_BEAB2|nr:uncharacterized protein BBA_09282 [Beauveria bassiana ARSEF 2860]EJP61791.1 hypothetical protein BBA_09282 [Beauveria bassiana ARSEF 2860]